MIFIFFIVSLMLAEATANPLATPTTSVLSCRDDICTDGHKRFPCAQRRLLCCKGEDMDSFQVLMQRNGFKCCTGSGKLYEVQREICVSGRVRHRGQNEENCGPHNIYNTTDQVCCGSNVYRKLEGGECCADKYLTGPSESCCNGIVKYNTYEQVCCPRLRNDPVLGKEQLFNIPYGRCCLEKPYNPKTQTCEEGERLLNHASRDMQICAGERYDPRTHGCCRGESTTVYEYRRMLCHVGRIYEKTDPHQNSVCTYNYIDDEGRNRREAIPYAKNSKMACSMRHGVISLGPLEALCGEDIYNTSTDLCCLGNIHEGMRTAGFTCCHKGTKIFHPDHQICCYNEVTESMAYNDGARCCFKNSFLPQTHDCDGSRVTEKACPSYESKCNVTVDALQRMKKHYIYFGIAGEMTQSRRGRKKVTRQWTFSDMQTLKFKKGKVTVVKARSRGTHLLKSTECGCPEHLIAGSRYMFISSLSIRRKTLSLENEGNGFIVPMEDKHQIGLVFETIIKHSR